MFLELGWSARIQIVRIHARCSEDRSKLKSKLTHTLHLWVIPVLQTLCFFLFLPRTLPWALYTVRQTNEQIHSRNDVCHHTNWCSYFCWFYILTGVLLLLILLIISSIYFNKIYMQKLVVVKKKENIYFNFSLKIINGFKYFKILFFFIVDSIWKILTLS